MIEDAQPRAKARTMGEGDALVLARACLSDPALAVATPAPSSRAAQDADRAEAPRGGWRVARPGRVANSYGYAADYTYLAARRTRGGVVVACIRSSGGFSTLDWSHAIWAVVPVRELRS